MQLITLGMHRSGTSLTTRLINMMGAYVGPEGSLVKAGKNNPKGYWERVDLVQCNIQLLKLYDALWPKHVNWPVPCIPKTVPETLGHEMQELVLKLDAFRPWVMKDPRLCLTLPYWMPYLEVPVAVIVYRDPLESAQSLRARDGTPLKYNIAHWELLAVSALRATAFMEKVHVSYAHMLEHPVNATEVLYKGLVDYEVQGIRLPSHKEINAFIDAKLYRSQVSEADRNEHALSDFQWYIAECMQGRENYDIDDMMLSPASREILEDMALNDPKGREFVR